MKKVQTQIKVIAKNLSALATKLEKLNSQLMAQPAKKAPAKKKAAAKPKKKVTTKAKAPKAPKAPKAAKAPKAKKTVAKKTKAADSKATVLDNVLDVISKSRNGATIANLKAKTKLESRQLSNALYKLSKKGTIKTVSRGVYVKA